MALQRRRQRRRTEGRHLGPDPNPESTALDHHLAGRSADRDLDRRLGCQGEALCRRSGPVSGGTGQYRLAAGRGPASAVACVAERIGAVPLAPMEGASSRKGSFRDGRDGSRPG